MGFIPSKPPTSMLDLALALGTHWINKPKPVKQPKPDKPKYILFYTDGERVYEFPLVCLYGNHIMHPHQFCSVLEQETVPRCYTFISSRHPIVKHLREAYHVYVIRDVHEASRISTPTR